jgi:hypothetical protein
VEKEWVLGILFEFRWIFYVERGILFLFNVVEEFSELIYNFLIIGC